MARFRGLLQLLGVWHCSCCLGQGGRFQVNLLFLLPLQLPKLYTAMSLAHMYLETRQKKNLELRVYHVKSGLIGHMCVHSRIVHFSSGGETSPQSVVPKHSASTSPYFPQSWSSRSAGDHVPKHYYRHALTPVLSTLHTTSQPNCEPQNSTVLYNYEVNEAS